MNISRKHICVAISVAIFSVSTVFFWGIFTKTKPSNATLTIEEFIRKNGYPIETYNVTSSDGYILTIHRIPHGRYQSHQNHKPVLFMHGMLHSASHYTHLGPDKALPFLLADKGYDIWLGNARGTTRSRMHQSLNPDKDAAFWDFSLHEIGVYDTRTFIDHVLVTTRKSKLHYVGFSQGCAVISILLAEQPIYAEKIRLVTALAPAVFVKNPKSPVLRFLVYFRRTIETTLETLNIQELFSSTGVMSSYFKYICDEDSIFVNLCLHQLFIVQGYDYHDFDKKLLALMFSHTPSGMSSKQLLHLVQMVTEGFQRYDFGAEENVKRYGQESPPIYDLSKVKTPIAAYFSSNDWLVDISNNETFVKMFPNVIKSYKVPSEHFNHEDFLHATNAVGLLYNEVIEEILKF